MAGWPLIKLHGFGKKASSEKAETEERLGVVGTMWAMTVMAVLMVASRWALWQGDASKEAS